MITRTTSGPRLPSALVRAWLGLGQLLGWINTRILLALVFFAVITPLALVFRLVGRDALALRLKTRASYWHTPERQWAPDSFKNQF